MNVLRTNLECPLCHRSEVNNLFMASDRLFGLGKEFQVVQCSYCELIWISPELTEDKLKTYYPYDYYPYNEPPNPMKFSLYDKIIYTLHHPLEVIYKVICYKVFSF